MRFCFYNLRFLPSALTGAAADGSADPQPVSTRADTAYMAAVWAAQAVRVVRAAHDLQGYWERSHCRKQQIEAVTHKEEQHNGPLCDGKIEKWLSV